MAELQARQNIFRLFDAHKYADAADAAHRYLEQHPSDEPVLQVLADSAINSGNVDAGERILDYLLTLSRPPFRLASKAVARSACGDLDGAMVMLKEALAIDPAHARSWSVLTGFHKFRANDPLITKAKRVLKSGKASPKSQRAILFTLSKAMNDLRKWNKAWDYAAKATAIETPVYEPAAIDRWIDQMEDAFDLDFLAARPGRGAQSAAPIFIVGMPRSGTTLMEIILAASGQVTALGELSAIPDICGPAASDDAARGNPVHNHMWVRRWRDDAFTALGEHYLQAAARNAGGEVPTHFTDKLPGNVMHLGQIGLMLPNARIIRMLRDPLDTCVSCFLGQFANGHQYTNRIDWLAHAANAYRRAGDIVAPMLPNPVLDVCYEDLVSAPEPQIRRVIEFLGLEWTPNCLTPAPVGYTTTTRSVGQVRKPINADSVGRWRRYSNRIGPLAQALGISLAKAA